MRYKYKVTELVPSDMKTMELCRIERDLKPIDMEAMSFKKVKKKT